jgi:hypothetical protein
MAVRRLCRRRRGHGGVPRLRWSVAEAEVAVEARPRDPERRAYHRRRVGSVLGERMQQCALLLIQHRRTSTLSRGSVSNGTETNAKGFPPSTKGRSCPPSFQGYRDRAHLPPDVFGWPDPPSEGLSVGFCPFTKATPPPPPRRRAPGSSSTSPRRPRPCRTRPGAVACRREELRPRFIRSGYPSSHHQPVPECDDREAEQCREQDGVRNEIAVEVELVR